MTQADMLNQQWNGSGFLGNRGMQTFANGNSSGAYDLMSALPQMNTQNTNSTFGPQAAQMLTENASFFDNNNFNQGWESLQTSMDTPLGNMQPQGNWLSDLGNSLPSWATMDNAKGALALFNTYNNWQNADKLMAETKRMNSMNIANMKNTANNNATNINQMVDNQATIKAGNVFGYNTGSDDFNQTRTQHKNDYNNKGLG